MSAREGWGQRRVLITPEAIESYMVNEMRIKSNLPEDARFLRMYPRPKGDYIMIFESSEWDELKEGEDIPKFEARVERANTKVTVQK